MNNECLFSMSCLRKHFIKSKVYHLAVYDDQMLLSEHKSMSSPKYILKFSFDSRIMWKLNDHEEVTCFGLLQDTRIKWFEGELSSLNQLKLLLSHRVFFGNISVFYDSIMVIGSGASSKVCHVKRKHDQASFAAKCISKEYLRAKKSNDRTQRLQQEIKIMQLINNHRFVNLLEMYQGENSYYLVMELLEGDTLYNYIRSYDSQLPNNQVRECMKIILQALVYLHGVGIVHRDIKLENLILAKQNDISSLKVIDLGLAVKESDKVPLVVCGTPGYIAPEVLQGQFGYFTTKCDMFAVGVIFYKLLTKRTLFRAENTHEIMESNKKCTLNFQDVEYKIQKEPFNLLQLLLQSDPQKRISAAEALDHPYFQCKLQDMNFLHDFHNDKATAVTCRSQKETHSVNDECHAATIKKSNPTNYYVRQTQKKRTRSPRKYADMQFYYPSFVAAYSDASKSVSREISKMDCTQQLIQSGNQQDEIIEDQDLK